ncbi:dynein heavy chain 9, axonemal-like, partial [Notothenia coriiceps]|uniref:Dynein heavy chain 9, axonemal-like n=1 Tax=Notothenia coriiceps TaxID=8208 RepID=A0A6I9MZD2_9TELE
ARVYLVPEEVLRGELSEGLMKVQTTLETLQLFRSTYDERRANLSRYQRNGVPVRPWDFSPLLVFSGLDCFINRVRSIKDILLTAVDLLKLDKLEIGGVRGRALSQQVQVLHRGFVETFKLFTEKPYHCLDLNNKEYEEDLREFKLKVDDTDRQVGAIFCQAFEETSGLEHAFKVLDMFGGLLERPWVATDALERFPLLVSMFDKELDCCTRLYKKHIQTAEERELDNLLVISQSFLTSSGWAPVNRNMPAVAGRLRWAQELQLRILTPFSKFRHLSYPCLESAEGARVIHKYEELTQLLNRKDFQRNPTVNGGKME